jgi:hypothetical protein
MKAVSKIAKSVVFAAILAGLVAVGPASAWAQNVFRTTKANTFKNTCPGGTGCSGWGFSVNVDEPSTGVEPVVVIWSARYFVNTADIYYAGLSVNGGACQTGVFGPTNLDDIATNPPGHFLTVTFQWIVLPTDTIGGTDVLVPGTNTFEVCGGGNGGVKGDSINISQNTLSVAKY